MTKGKKKEKLVSSSMRGRLVMAGKDKLEADGTLCISVAVAARILGVSRNTGYEMVRLGQLPTIRCERRRLVVPKAALLKMLEETGARIHINKINGR